MALETFGNVPPVIRTQTFSETAAMCYGMFRYF